LQWIDTGPYVGRRLVEVGPLFQLVVFIKIQQRPKNKKLLGHQLHKLLYNGVQIGLGYDWQCESNEVTITLLDGWFDSRLNKW
jgi:hypothetical protein